MRHYYEVCPRGFANEYTVYVVSAEYRDRFEAAFPDAERITRAQAVRRGLARPAEARRHGEQWFGGLYLPNGRGTTVAETLDICERYTVIEIEQREAYAGVTA